MQVQCAAGKATLTQLKILERRHCLSVGQFASVTAQADSYPPIKPRAPTCTGAGGRPRCTHGCTGASHRCTRGRLMQGVRRAAVQEGQAQRSAAGSGVEEWAARQQAAVIREAQGTRCASRKQCSNPRCSNFVPTLPSDSLMAVAAPPMLVEMRALAGMGEDMVRFSG